MQLHCVIPASFIHNGCHRLSPDVPASPSDLNMPSPADHSTLALPLMLPVQFAGMGIVRVRGAVEGHCSFTPLCVAMISGRNNKK